jgi:hypothetical protein
MNSKHHSFRLANYFVSLLLAGGLTAAAHSATLIHNYQLNTNFADSLGGPALTPTGALGSFNGVNYAFDRNSGLSLSNAVNSTDYSILINFQFAADTGYRKIVDFKNLSADSGLYNLSRNLNFYPVATGSGQPLLAGQSADVLLTRDGATGTFAGYVNGIQAISFTDSSNLATFSATNQIIHFFRDDNATGGGESAAGLVGSICVFDGAISASGASGASCNVVSAVPEPSEWAMMIVGLGLIGRLAKRRRQI